MRRRLGWTAGFVAAAAGAAGLVIAFPGPDERVEETFTPAPNEIKPPPKKHSFAPRAGNVLDVARKFVLTAVARKHTEDSWELVTPSLKQGFTKQTWAKGDIPVVPYPVYSGRWRIGYSLEKEVMVEIALFPKPTSKIRPVVFDLRLRRFARPGGFRWLVDSFVPAASPSGDDGSQGTPLLPSGGRGVAAQVGTIWLVLPGAILGSVLLLLAVLGIRGWRGRRTYRAYVRERQISSTRPS